jgi:protein required for attachment to host cells
MKTIWFVVGNASRAQILEQSGPEGPVVEVTVLEHGKSRLRNLDISSDKPGRTHHRRRDGMRGSMEPRTTPKEVEREQFARKIVECLEQHTARVYKGDLILVAPPRFLGLLRQMLPEALSARVVNSVDKDLTAIKPDQLLKKLRDFIPSHR